MGRLSSPNEYSGSEFLEFAAEYEPEYTNRALKGTNVTVSSLIEYIEHTDHGVELLVKNTDDEPGQVLGFTAYPTTADDVVEIVNRFGLMVISDMKKKENSEVTDGVTVTVHFD